jgi:hypothetical protein
LELSNLDEEPKEINYGFIFKDKNGNIIRKDNQDSLKLSGSSGEIMITKELKNLVGLDEVDLVVANKNGMILKESVQEYLNKMIQSAGFKTTVLESPCFLDKTRISCDARVDNSPATLTVYRAGVFGEKIVGEEVN